VRQELNFQAYNKNTFVLLKGQGMLYLKLMKRKLAIILAFLLYFVAIILSNLALLISCDDSLSSLKADAIFDLSYGKSDSSLDLSSPSNGEVAFVILPR